MANNRVFYACQAVVIGDTGSLNSRTIHGVQSVGITTNFNLEQAFELVRFKFMKILKVFQMLR